VLLQFALPADQNPFSVACPEAVLRICQLSIDAENQQASVTAKVWSSKAAFDDGKQPLRTIQVNAGRSVPARPATYIHARDPQTGEPLYEADGTTPVMVIDTPATPAVPGYTEMMAPYTTEYANISQGLYQFLQTSYPMLAGATVVQE
jgi:hypothetical protein